MSDILDYIIGVETDLKNGVRGVQMKNSLLPLKMLLPLHSDILAETNIVENLNETIKTYIALYETDQDDSLEGQVQSSVIKILKDILQIEYIKETMCTGPEKNMSPHKADPQIFADHGMCATCLLRSGAFVNVNSIGGNKKSRKPKEKSDTLLKNIMKCIEEVLDEEEQKELKNCLKDEDKISGNIIFQKLKAIRMSKTEGNWSLLKNKIDQDALKLSSAFGVHTVVYMYHQKQKKILKLGMETRKRCKQIGNNTTESGQVLNTFTLAENHLTNVLQNVRGESLPSKMQACLAAKVLNALGRIGIRKLSAEKISTGFTNSEEFSIKFENWMDQLEKSGESSLAADEEESDTDEYKNEVSDPGLSREEVIRQNENGDNILSNEVEDSTVPNEGQIFARSPRGSLIQVSDDQFVNAKFVLEDGHLIAKENENQNEGVRVLASCVDGVQRLDGLMPGPSAPVYVGDQDVSMMKSFTQQNKQRKKRKSIKTH